MKVTVGFTGTTITDRYLSRRIASVAKLIPSMLFVSIVTDVATYKRFHKTLGIARAWCQNTPVFHNLDEEYFYHPSGIHARVEIDMDKHTLTITFM